MKFGYTIVYVDDVEATIAFYEKAFGAEAPHGRGGRVRRARDRRDQARLRRQEDAAWRRPVRQPGGKVLGVEVAFVTDDVAAAYDTAVAAGAVSVSRPEKKPWGQIVAYVRDNNGFLVELCTPVG